RRGVAELRALVLGTGVRRQLDRPDQRPRPVTQGLHEAHEVAVDVVDRLDRYGVLGEEDSGRPGERFNVHLVLGKQAGQKGAEPPLSAVVLERRAQRHETPSASGWIRCAYGHATKRTCKILQATPPSFLRFPHATTQR